MSWLLWITAAVCAGGILLIVTGLMRWPAPPPDPDAPPPPENIQEQFEQFIKRVDTKARALARKAEDSLHGKPSLRQDAKLLGRSLESHALAKVGGAVGGTAFGAFGGMLATIMGIGLGALPIVVLASAAGFLGWWLPDSMLKTDADKARVKFQQVTESWLELVAQLVTAGADTFAALYAAANYSDQPVFGTIRDSLKAAAASGEPPWTGLRKMADERRLPFLDPFCAALELAGTTGAGSRQAILSQVDAARSKALHAADARAASAGEKMGAPLAMIGGAFMVLMGYPPMAGIMESATLTGPGL